MLVMSTPIHPIWLISGAVSSHRRLYPFHGEAASKRGSKASVARIGSITGVMWLALGATAEDMAYEVITDGRMGRRVGWWIRYGV